MLAANIAYFVTVNPVSTSVPAELEFLNRVSLPVLQRVSTSQQFTPIETNGSQRLLLFRHAAQPD
jgi:hypothetical protein